MTLTDAAQHLAHTSGRRPLATRLTKSIACNCEIMQNIATPTLHVSFVFHQLLITSTLLCVLRSNTHAIEDSGSGHSVVIAQYQVVVDRHLSLKDGDATSAVL